MKLIQMLIDEGALVLYHDYRASHALDMSGQGNDGALTLLSWQGGGLRFNAGTSKVTVADSAELQGTAFTLVVLGEFITQGIESLIVKRDAGGTSYDLNLTAANVQLYDGTNTRTLAVSVIGKRCIAVNGSDGTTGEVFLDGISAGALDAASAISVDNADLLIGNDHDDGNNTLATIHAAMIVNRVLTADEHATLYAELAALTWPSKVTGRAAASMGVELLTDGDMEAAGVAAWTVGNAATLTKETGNALSGIQVLRVAHNGTASPYAYQVILALGTHYRITGRARGDGTAHPRLAIGGVYVWIGATSTGWQAFDIVISAQDTSLVLMARTTAASYCEFDNVTVKEIQSDEVQFKTDFQAHASNVNETAGFIENTPFEIVSGTHKVSAVISGDDTFKQIDTVVAGIYVLDGKLFHVDPALAAYGTWDFWLYKANASAVSIAFVAQALTGITAGDYVLAVDASEAVTLGISGGATLITGAVSHSTWTHIKITRRQSDGLFELFIDDVSAGTGTNATLKASAGMVFDFDAGDSLALSNVHGDYSLAKKLGVL